MYIHCWIHLKSPVYFAWIRDISVFYRYNKRSIAVFYRYKKGTLGTMTVRKKCLARRTLASSAGPSQDHGSVGVDTTNKVPELATEMV